MWEARVWSGIQSPFSCGPLLKGRAFHIVDSAVAWPGGRPLFPSLLLLLPFFLHSNFPLSLVHYGTEMNAFSTSSTTP